MSFRPCSAKNEVVQNSPFAGTGTFLEVFRRFDLGAWILRIEYIRTGVLHKSFIQRPPYSKMGLDLHKPHHMTTHPTSSRRQPHSTSQSLKVNISSYSYSDWYRVRFLHLMGLIPRHSIYLPSTNHRTSSKPTAREPPCSMPPRSSY